MGYILFFENLSDNHSCTVYNEYEYKNMAIFGTYPNNQKEAKISIKLKPGQRQILIFRQLNGKDDFVIYCFLGKMFIIEGGDFQVQFNKVRF